MLITVIVPIYNMESYLRTCIDSLLRQTFDDCEILLIDDGSRDASGAICDEYARLNDRVRVVHKSNGGPGSARNTGIEHARGEYLAFCDPDDRVDPDYLERLVEPVSDHRTMPVTGILQHREGKPDRRLTAPAMNVADGACVEGIVALRRCDMLGFLVGKLLSKRIIDAHGIRFIEDLKHREDEIFMVEYVRYVSRIVISERTTYHYRVLGTGLSKKRKPAALQLEVSQRLYDLFLKAAPTPEGCYVAARIRLQQSCEAVSAARTGAELHAVAEVARNARREYLEVFDPAFLRERRDRKVASRSRLVFAAGALSNRVLRRLCRLVHI